MAMNADIHRNAEDEIDLRMLIHSLRRKWHYFLISALLFFLCAWAYIRFTPPVYEARTSILIKDSKNSSKNIEDFLTGDLFGNTKNIATEIGILKSRTVLQNTIQELNLGISYFRKSAFFSFPLYKSQPFLVNPLHISEGIYDEPFTITMLDSGRFKLAIEADNIVLKNYHYEATHHFGDEIKTPYFSIRVDVNGMPENSGTHDDFDFIINSENRVIASYDEKLKAESMNKDATIVEISIKDEIPQRAIDFLNTMSKVYVDRDVQDKTSVAALALKFVDEQLEEISKTLHVAEEELQKFKEEKGTVNLSEESKAYLERISEVDADRVKADITLKSLDYLYNYVLQNQDQDEMTPSSLGNTDPLLVLLITRLKELQGKKKSLASGSHVQSPAIRVIDEQIDQTKKALIENINNIRNLTRVNLQGINNQLTEYEKSIRKIPNIERELLGIQRNFSVNENMYVYLLQKKAETGIAKATALSDNKVLDVASVNDIAVEPDIRMVMIVSILLTLFFPFILILAQSYFRYTIGGREDIEKLTRIPIIGLVGHHPTGERLVVATKPKSFIAEAFRSIRANLMFMGLADQHKVVMILSSVGGEGKSFTTLNLATVLSLQHHRVIIVGMDLRKPQLAQDLGVKNDQGVSTYLIGKAKLEEIIQKTKIENLDIISSGPVPPNPAELLSKKETSTLIHELRLQYDYIIIDTPPVGIVSDAIMLMNLADINVFVLRENYSRKEYIRTINEYYAQGKIKNLCILLNDAGMHRTYGYGYGYKSGHHGDGYYDEGNNKAGILRRIFNKS